MILKDFDNELNSTFNPNDVVSKNKTSFIFYMLLII